MALPTLASARPSRGKAASHVSNSRIVDSSFPNRNCHCTTALQNGMVLITGGFIANRPTSSVLLLNPTTGETADAAPMISGRARHAAVGLPDGRVVVMGGFNRVYLGSAEVYDPYSNSWTSLQNLPSPRADFTANIADHGLLLVGGTGPIVMPGTAYYEVRAN